MVNAPPCPACGYALRWIPESNAWGCDRCRQLYPAQPQPQMHAPQQHYGQPHGAMQQAWGQQRSPGSSKLVLWGVIGLLVVSGGVVGLVFAMRGGGGGASSPEDVIKATLAAEAAGDAEALVKLADPQAVFDRGFECKGEAARDEDISPEKQTKKMRDKMDELVKTTKGLTIELVESKRGEEGKNNTKEKGEEVVPGCTAKEKLSFVTYELKLKVTAPGGKPGEQNTKLNMLDVGGRYFLFQPPRVKAASKDAEALEAMTKFKDQMCSCKVGDKACGDKVAEDMMKWGQQMAKDASASPEPPDPETAKKAADIMTMYSECQKKLVAVDPAVPPTAPPDPGAGSGSGSAAVAPLPPPVELPEAPSDMPSSCKDYREIIVKLQSCPKYPAKDAVAEVWKSLVKSWPKLASSRSAKKQTAKTCTQALDLTRKATADICP